MHDTPREIEDRLWAMYAERTPEERLRMVFSMFETAKALLRAGILHEQPDLSEAEIRRELFLRLHGNDFSPEERDKIGRYIMNGTR